MSTGGFDKRDVSTCIYLAFQSNDLSAPNAKTFSSCSLRSFKNKMAESTTDCFRDPRFDLIDFILDLNFRNVLQIANNNQNQILQWIIFFSTTTVSPTNRTPSL